MAISISLLRQPQPSIHHRKLPISKTFPCRITLLKTRSSPLKDHNYRLSWKNELQNAYPSESSSAAADNGDEKLQELIDRRCTDNLRMLIVDSVQNAKAGHPGMALGMAGIGFFLYRHVLRYNPRNPKWFDRDRFVLSAGHGCLLQYACLHLAGFHSVQELIDRRCTDNLRMLIVDSVQNAKAGHPGMALGMAGIGFFLYRHVLRYNPRNPKWFDRDRFVLSAGHGCLLQYACLHLAGFHSVQELIDRSCTDNLRMLIVDSVQNAKAGHPGMALGMAGIGFFLYRHVLRYNPRNPKWFDRDRFVLSAGHGCLLQYACLHLAGFHSVQLEDLKRLCKLGSRTPGHPENTLTDGIEVTTGPLGQGVANAVGLALAEAHLSARFNKPDVSIVDHRTYCIMGDGCAMEGITHEAASLAAHWKLNKLTLIYDDNGNTIDGSTDLTFSEDISLRFKALGWNVVTADDTHAHGNTRSFKNALISAYNETTRPTFVRVQTKIGKLSKKEGTSAAHHAVFDTDDEKQMKHKVKWDGKDPFYVIPMVYREMQVQGEVGMELESEWHSKLQYYQRNYPQEAAEFKSLLDGGMLPGWEDSLPKWSTSDPVDATRGYSEKCLNQLARVLPGLIGGSADLASSNKAYLHGYGDFQQPASPWGRNIRYGVREHAMAGISNGIALHGVGLIPFAATFLVFSDYMKNSMRLSALSHAAVIYIMTHDSIGLGEDGPTHQPVEHLAGLRAIPRLLVLRPADGNETAGAYRVAVANRDAPSVIALSRQKVAGHVEGTSADAVERGGYVVSDNSGPSLPEIIFIGTGSELCLCTASADVLRKEGRRVRVVSLVCWRLFDRQTAEYKEEVLPPRVSRRVSVEAGSPVGWREYVGADGLIVGVEEFGASGAYLDTLENFGFTVENITNIAKKSLSL